MTNIVLNSKMWIPISELDISELIWLKDKLTIVPKICKAYDPNAKTEPIYLYNVHEGLFGIPRAFGYTRYLLSDVRKNDMNVSDYRTDERGTIEFRSDIVLWEEQEQPVSDVLSGLLEGSNGGLLQSACGSGKTVMALKVVAELGAPTLIILHDEGLLGQWKKDTKKFLNLKDSEIGHVQGPRCDYIGKKIVFAVTQSLHARRKSYPIGLYSYPTLVIYDEVHRAGSRTFCTWMDKVRAKFRFGLSATPRRWDGAENIFKWHIGEVFAIGKANNMAPKIFQIFLPKLCPDLQRANGTWLIPTMISMLSGSKTPKGKTKAIVSPNVGSIRRVAYMTRDIVQALQKGR